MNEVDPEFKRDGMLIRRFMGKTAIKMFTIATIAFIAYLITETPILTNQVAMGQMENSNDWFVAMQIYQDFANVAGRVSRILITIIVGWIGYDGYSLAKNLKTNEN